MSRSLNIIHLLRRNIVGLSSHVNLLVMVHTRNDEEHSGTPGSALEQTTKSEDDSSLILLQQAIMKLFLETLSLVFMLPLCHFANISFLVGVDLKCLQVWRYRRNWPGQPWPRNRDWREEWGRWEWWRPQWGDEHRSPDPPRTLQQEQFKIPYFIGEPRQKDDWWHFKNSWSLLYY